MPGYVTKIIILGLDTLFTLIAISLSILLINNFDLASSQRILVTLIPILLPFRILSYIIFRTYLIIIRYIGEKDYLRVFWAVSASSLLFGIGFMLFPGKFNFNGKLSFLIIDYVLLLLAMISLRISLRSLVDQIKSQKNGGVPIAIFGAGELGAMLHSVLKHNTLHSYRIVAFFDDNPKVHKKLLNGVTIFNPDKSFDAVIRKNNIKEVIIAITNLSEKRRIEFINACLEHKLKVLKVPPIASWINNKLNVGQLENIKFEDLLSRPPIQLNLKSIKDSVEGKVVVVTGCAGSIGSEIVRQLLHYNPLLVIGLDQAETPLAELGLSLKNYVNEGVFKCVIGDVRDKVKLDNLFDRYRPNYVFHAAAYKHVPVMEQFPEEAIKVNVLGTKTIADLATRYGVDKFVMISTDKVVNPSNVMGASKRIAEIYVQSLNYKEYNQTQFITTRFGNVLGSNGSVIPIFKRQIAQRKPVTVTHPEVTRFFMTIPEACQLVLEAGAMGKGGEIFIFDMGKPVKIVELARKMVQMAGLTPDEDIEIIYTGLRPGEKLYEELLDGGEGILKTHHPKIKKAQVRVYDFYSITDLIDQIIELAGSGQNAASIVQFMKNMVPEFASQNSEFSKLDKFHDDVGK